MTFTKLACAFALLSVVAACSGNRLPKAEMATPGGDQFSRALYTEYVRLSKAEYAEGDYIDSDAFADRAIASAAGSPPGPEEVSRRDQTPANAGALESARARLMAVYGGDVRQRLPAETAKAQAMFDCWAQELEENFQPDHIDNCRIAYFIELTKLEEKPQSTPAPAPARAAAPAAAPAAKPSTTTFLVYFGFNSAALDATAEAVLQSASNVVKSSTPAVISVIGHTDGSGASDYNARLAERRANVVAEALRQRGVPGRLITIGALGENAPAIQTTANARERGNRRVEVTVRY